MAEKKPARKLAKLAIDLAAMRGEIDGIDRWIEALISERTRLAQQLGRAMGKLAAALAQMQARGQQVCLPGAFPVTIP